MVRRGPNSQDWKQRFADTRSAGILLGKKGEGLWPCLKTGVKVCSGVASQRPHPSLAGGAGCGRCAQPLCGWEGGVQAAVWAWFSMSTSLRLIASKLGLRCPCCPQGGQASGLHMASWVGGGGGSLKDEVAASVPVSAGWWEVLAAAAWLLWSGAGGLAVPGCLAGVLHVL